MQWLDLVFLDHDYTALRDRAIDPSTIDVVAWNALHPGGRFVVVERDLESSQARAEIERFGFRFASEALFLRAGASPSDWSGGDPSAREKRVLLTFTKP